MARRHPEIGTTAEAASYLLLELRQNRIHRRRWRLLPIVLGMAVGTAATVLFFPPIGALGAIFAGAALAWLGRTKLTFGRDGLVIRSLRHLRGRFIAYRDVHRVKRFEGWSGAGSGIALHLADGTDVDLRLNPIGESYFRSLEGPAVVTYVAHEARGVDGTLVLVARTLMKEAHESDDGRLAMLEPGNETTAEWMQRMRALNDRATFRAPSIPREQFWDVLESPGADPRIRAAAAVLIGAPADDDEQARMEQMAHSSVAPGLEALVLAVVKKAPDTELARALDCVRKGYRPPSERHPLNDVDATE